MLISPLISLGKPLLESYQAYSPGYKFLKSLIIVGNPNFIIGNRYYALLSLNALFIFGETSVKYSNLNSHSSSVKWKWCSMKKVASSALNSNKCTSTFPWERHHASVYSKSALSIFSISSYRIFFKCVEGLGFNKITFTVLLRIFLNKTSKFIYCKNMRVRNTMASSTVWYHWLGSC